MVLVLPGFWFWLVRLGLDILLGVYIIIWNMNMESPFSAENTTIVLYLEPFLDSYNKTYINILTLSGMPKGPLENMVTRIHPRALSEYQSSSLSLSRDCMHALLRYPKSGGGGVYKQNNPYMYAEDIPSVLSCLIIYVKTKTIRWVKIKT